MTKSSIYVTCPGCSETTLILNDARGCRCAGCGLDYQALAADKPRFEAFLVARMREGAASQLGAIAVHQWASGLSAADAAREFRALAERNDVALPPPIDPSAFVRNLLIGVAIVVVALASALTYLVMSS